MSFDFNDFCSPAYHKHSLMVHSYDVDFNKHLTITSLFNYFQEIAWEHADILRFGLNDLSKNNQFWVLSRVRVEIDQLPKWTDNIRLITYPRGVDGLLALRDYEIYNSMNERIIGGSSSWIILNAENHRPVKLAEQDLVRYSNPRSALVTNASKIKEVRECLIKEEVFSVKPGDIDVNQHVNNTRYIDWAINAFSFQHYQKFQPKIIEVNFMAEGKQDDNIKIQLFEIAEDENIINIKRTNDLKDLARVYVKWGQ